MDYTTVNAVAVVKKCSKCKKELPISEEYFFKRKSSKDGFRGTCKECSGGGYGKHRHSQIEINCEHCNELFSVEPNRQSKRFCSRACYYDSISKNGSPKRNGAYVTCLGCGGRYYKALNSIVKSCSIKCSSALQVNATISSIEKANGIPSLKDYLLQEYSIDKKTLRCLSKELNVNSRTISKILKQFGIEMIISNRTFSHGEARVNEWFKASGLEYKKQYFFDDCRREKPLPFDFAVLENGNVSALVEYDGQQHYHPVEVFGGEKAFQKTKANDQIKSDYCASKGITLIRIPYWELENIEEFLSVKFNELYKPIQLSIL